MKNKCGKYWWNNGINELRENVIKARRTVTRAKRKANIAIDVLIKESKEMRRKLKYEIAKGRKRAWMKFCENLERDPWGKPYRMLKARCKNKFPSNDMPLSKVRTIINELFITRRGPLLQDIVVRDTTDNEEHDLIIEKDDVKEIAEKMNSKKVVGIDGVISLS